MYASVFEKKVKLLRAPRIVFDNKGLAGYELHVDFGVLNEIMKYALKREIVKIIIIIIKKTPENFVLSLSPFFSEPSFTFFHLINKCVFV